MEGKTENRVMVFLFVRRRTRRLCLEVVKAHGKYSCWTSQWPFFLFFPPQRCHFIQPNKATDEVLDNAQYKNAHWVSQISVNTVNRTCFDVTILTVSSGFGDKSRILFSMITDCSFFSMCFGNINHFLIRLNDRIRHCARGNAETNKGIKVQS